MKRHDFEFCWERPYLLDTPEKVSWANERRGELLNRKWKLGDHCFYRPLDMGNTPA